MHYRGGWRVSKWFGWSEVRGRDLFRRRVIEGADPGIPILPRMAASRKRRGERPERPPQAGSLPHDSSRRAKRLMDSSTKGVGCQPAGRLSTGRRFVLCRYVERSWSSSAVAAQSAHAAQCARVLHRHSHTRAGRRFRPPQSPPSRSRCAASRLAGEPPRRLGNNDSRARTTVHTPSLARRDEGRKVHLRRELRDGVHILHNVAATLCWVLRRHTPRRSECYRGAAA
jgi:hypothetical protein